MFLHEFVQSGNLASEIALASVLLFQKVSSKVVNKLWVKKLLEHKMVVWLKLQLTW